MARNDTFIAASPARVFQQLADGRSYGDWVVGTREIRRVEPDWPAAGSSIQPIVGLGPVASKGRTIVEEVTPPWRLVLRVSGGPLGTAVVDLRLRPEGTGTRITLVEDPAHPVANWNPLAHALIRVRNVRSLQRLKGLSEAGPSPRP